MKEKIATMNLPRNWYEVNSSKYNYGDDLGDYIDHSAMNDFDIARLIIYPDENTKIRVERKQSELKAKIKSIKECHDILAKGEYTTYNLNVSIIDIPTIVADFNMDNSNTNLAKISFKGNLIASISVELSNKKLKIKVSDPWIKLLDTLEIESKYKSYSNLEDLQFIIDWVEESRLAMCEYFL